MSYFFPMVKKTQKVDFRQRFIAQEKVRYTWLQFCYVQADDPKLEEFVVEGKSISQVVPEFF